LVEKKERGREAEKTELLENGGERREDRIG